MLDPTRMFLHRASQSDRRPLLGRSAALVVLALLAVTATGAAQPKSAAQRDASRARVEVDAETAAKVLLMEGRELLEANEVAKACAKLEMSVELDPGIGARLSLADCWEKLGRSASAFKLFREVADVAKEAADDELEKEALERAEALEPKLTRLTIRVEKPLPGMEVRRNTTVIPAVYWGAPLPVDPGPTVFSAVAPGKKAWSRELDIAASPGSELRLVIPVLLDQAPNTTEPAVTPEKNVERGKRVPTSAWIMGGAGVVALAVGVVGAVEYRSKNADAEGICEASVGCTEEEIRTHEELVDEARSARGIAFLGFGVGTAALLGATVIYLFDPPKQTSASVRAGAAVDRHGSWQAVMRGTW